VDNAAATVPSPRRATWRTSPAATNRASVGDDISPRGHQFDRDVLRATFSQVRVQQQVLGAMHSQSRPRPWFEYRPAFVNRPRIAGGARFWQDHAAALERAREQFGVPPELVVATIAAETLFGKMMGTHPVLDSLATLAFDFPKRAEFFRGELEQFLLLARELDVDPAQVRGSFAGAMGIPQFMPSSYRKFAVDYDGDGRIDLFASPADAIGSVANYFKAFNWQPGLPTHFAVRFDADKLDLDALLAPDILPTFSLPNFQAKGAVLEGAALAHTGRLALIEQEKAAKLPGFVGI
jgi:membrane-bound lytic murein transglycosylase B